MKRHFGKTRLHDLVTSSRTFPITARVDTQSALEKLLASPGVKLYGVHRQYSHETLTFANLMQNVHDPAVISPLQCEDAAVLFVLTTNRPEHLEAALASRPGRIDQAIEFPLPDDHGRRQLVRLYACGLRLSEEVAESLVKKTKGASAAFIKELMRRAAQFTLQDGKNGTLTSSEVDSALEEMLFAGGSLNAKLLGATGVSHETTQ